MPKGFFSTSDITAKAPPSKVPKCGLCGLYKHCNSPKMPSTGEGRKKILVVAEAPGEREDKKNTQLIGKSGKLLRRHLKRLGVDLDRDCWKTNAVICRREENKTPDDVMIDACRPNLFKTIRKYKPNSIILLGRVAITSMLKEIWKESIGKVSRWGGYAIPCTNSNAWLIPTFHPSYILRGLQDTPTEKAFHKHLRMGVKKAKRKPWKEIPDYKSQSSERNTTLHQKRGKDNAGL